MTVQPETTKKTALMQRLVSDLAEKPYRDAAQLLVSVSGGVDSMVLLDVLVRTAHVHRAPLVAMYAHHHTGPFADVSFETVSDYCRQAGVPLLRRDFHWSGEGNFEQAAGAFRRFVLKQTCHPNGYVVLAHHAEDQLETFLQKMVRGLGPASLPAMLQNRDRRLRPLLRFSKAELIAHAGETGLPHVLDPANLDRQRFRTAIRHEVTPVLNRFHNRAADHCGAWLSDQQQLLSDLHQDAATRVEAAFSGEVLPRAAFDQAPPYLWSFMLHHFLSLQNLPPLSRRDGEQVQRWLASESCGQLDVRGGRFYCDWDGLVVEPQPVETARHALFGEATRWHRWQFSLEMNQNLNRRAEDQKYRLEPNRATPRAVKDYLRRQRVPLRLRQNLPAFVIGGRAYHFVQLLQLEQAGFLQSYWYQGPDPRPYFPNLPPQRPVDEAWRKHGT